VAKKSKTPPPPRTKGPQQRTGPNDADRRRKLVLYGAGVSGIVVLAAVVIAIAVAGGGGGGGGSSADASNSAMKAAGCTFRAEVPVVMKSSDHSDVPTLSTPMDDKWKSFPPAGGPHYGQWAVWGFYTEPVNPRMVVHNEEHGGVILWWGPDVPKSTVDALHALYSEDPVSMVGTPIAGLGSKIAISAWTGDPSRYFRDNYFGVGHLGTCTTWNDEVKKAFTEFRDAYRGKGPEGIPMSQNQPGSQ